MKKAFIFPGQGAQYPGMGKDFINGYSIAKRTLEEADDILGRKLSDIIMTGPDAALTETKNSQTGIYVISMAILRVIDELFPDLKPELCTGLSLGEYTAATAAGYLTFSDGLSLVQYRGKYMNEACESSKGTMAVVLGLDADAVQEIIQQVNLPNDLWAANFNCPGQVVISGTVEGINAGSKAAEVRGSKRVIPLQVHSAFHSWLMAPAKAKLSPHVMETHFNSNHSELIMNVTGGIVNEESMIRTNLIEQVTSPIKWEESVRCMDENQVGLYIEMGPGKTLAGFNKRIGVSGKTVSIETVNDLKSLEEALNN